MKHSYSILVNTCDKFEDCWDPFFKLWSFYWPNCSGKLHLNTEYKEYSYPGLDINSIKGCQLHKIPETERATWSQCLKWALNTIEDDIVLYMQEDYFLKDYANNDIVENYVKLMYENNDIKCIHLTDQSVNSSGKSKFKNLEEVVYDQRYRVSCQAALWRKQELTDIIRDYENAWEFEEFGSQRSAKLANSYFVVDANQATLNKNEIIPYVFTGIIQGRWYEEVIPLFKKHNIIVDYTQRGFVKDTPKKPLLKKIDYFLQKIPKIIRHKIDLYSIQSSH